MATVLVLSTIFPRIPPPARKINVSRSTELAANVNGYLVFPQAALPKLIDTVSNPYLIQSFERLIQMHFYFTPDGVSNVNTGIILCEYHLPFGHGALVLFMARVLRLVGDTIAPTVIGQRQPVRQL